jgi:hypothetical protein
MSAAFTFGVQTGHQVRERGERLFGGKTTRRVCFGLGWSVPAEGETVRRVIVVLRDVRV